MDLFSRLAQLSSDTAYLSGGWEKHPLYQEIVAEGDVNIPHLLDALRKEEGNCWIIMGLLADITCRKHNDIQPGVYEEVRKAWLSWDSSNQ